MFTVLVYRFLDDSTLDLIRRIPHVLSVEFKDGYFSVFVLSSGDDEPDIIPVDSSFFLACCHG